MFVGMKKGYEYVSVVESSNVSVTALETRFYGVVYLSPYQVPGGCVGANNAPCDGASSLRGRSALVVPFCPVILIDSCLCRERVAVSGCGPTGPLVCKNPCFEVGGGVRSLGREDPFGEEVSAGTHVVEAVVDCRAWHPAPHDGILALCGLGSAIRLCHVLEHRPGLVAV